MAVVGVGNLLLMDEGVGVHVVQQLEKRGVPSNVILVDGGTSPDALALLGDVDKLVIIDAVRGGGEPGSIYRLRPEDVEEKEKNPLSLHDWDVMDSLKLSRYWTEDTEVIIIGVEPAEMEWGVELSRQIQAAMPRVIDAVLDEFG